LFRGSRNIHLKLVGPKSADQAGLAFATAPTTAVNVSIHDTHHAFGLFNPFVGSQLTWDLGDGWGFTYEKNYGGKDTRLWSRLVVPLGSPPPGLRPIL
jgi:hypothetical protein